MTPQGIFVLYNKDADILVILVVVSLSLLWMDSSTLQDLCHGINVDEVTMLKVEWVN